MSDKTFEGQTFKEYLEEIEHLDGPQDPETVELIRDQFEELADGEGEE